MKRGVRDVVVTQILKKRRVRDFSYMTVGLLLTAWALDAFLIPNKLAAGGASGLATIIYYRALEMGVTIPIGLQILAINAVLMFFVFRSGGIRYAAKTMYGIIGLSVAIEVFARITVPLAVDDPLLAALYGGAISGIGMGLVFKAGGNTGGTDILAQLIAPRTSLGLGQLMLIIDAMIVLLAAFQFGAELALYAVVAIVVAGYVIDVVLEGISVEKAVWIISDYSEKIGESINSELGRGATAIEATGVWTGERRGMLFVVLSRRELDGLKALVAAHDPRALVIISDVHEAIGEGFKEMGIE